MLQVMSRGMLFQSRAVFTKNDHFLQSFLADGIASVWCCECPDVLVGLLKYFCWSIATLVQHGET
jgi:hypothetical protein